MPNINKLQLQTQNTLAFDRHKCAFQCIIFCTYTDAFDDQYLFSFAIFFQLCNFVIHIKVYERSIKRKYFFEIGSFKNNLYLCT